MTGLLFNHLSPAVSRNHQRLIQTKSPCAWVWILRVRYENMRVEPGNLGLNTVFSSSAPSPHSTGNCNLLKLCSRYTLFTSSLARNLSSKNEYNLFFYESSEICMKIFKLGKGGSGAQLQTDLSWKFSDTFFEAKLFQLSQVWVDGRAMSSPSLDTIYPC